MEQSSFLARNTPRLRGAIFLLGVISTCLFGAEPEQPTQPPNVSDLIKHAIQDGETKVKIPPGVYRLSETIKLERISNLEISGYGATILMTVPKETLRIHACSNISIKGLTFDYEPLPFTQGTITAIQNLGLTMEFTVHEGYPDLRPDMAAGVPRHIFDPTTRQWKKDANTWNTPRLEIIDPRHGRAHFGQPQHGVAVGDLIAFDQRSLNHAAFCMIKGCPGSIEFADIAVHASPCVAFLGRDNGGQTTFRRVKIERGPRPPGATEDRLLSSNADGVNYANGRRGPILEDCDFSFMGDDALNVHGSLLAIMRVLSPTELLVARPSRPEGFFRLIQPNETADILQASTFSPLKSVAIQSFLKYDVKTDITTAEIKALFPRFSKARFTVYQVTLSRPADSLKAGQWMNIPGLNSPGFLVKNSHFHDHRARGLRIEGSHGRIEGNVFERIGTIAIQIGPELQLWREAGWVSDVQVVGNQIRNIGFSGDVSSPSSYAFGAITICARIDTQRPPFPQGNRDITIEGNTIEDCPACGILAYGAKNLVIRNNVLRRTNLGDTSKTGNNFSLSSKLPIELEDVSGANLEGNTISEDTR